MTTYVAATDIISRLIRLSGQVPGTSVQTYSEDVLLDMIRSAVRTAVRMAWWPHLMETLSGTLDGTTGVVTTDLVGVDDHTDLFAVFLDSHDRPLNLRSDNSNPNSNNQYVCYEILPLSNANYATRLIKVFPVTTTGGLSLRVRKVPAITSDASIVPLDQDLITYGVLWSYFEAEGDNPQQAGMYKTLMDNKFTELMSSISTHRVPISRSGSTDGWMEA